jgi:sugar lactone lactonase YvrE
MELKTVRRLFHAIAILLLTAWHLVFPSPAAAKVLYVGVGAPNESNGAIYRFMPDGSNSVFADGLPGPFTLAVDASGNLYEGTSVINKVTAGGNLSTFATAGDAPEGLAFDSNGNLFAACFQGIYKITSSGLTSLYASLPHGIYSQAALAFDANGNLFAGNYGVGGTSGGVLQIRSDGQFTTFATGLSGGYGLAFDANGQLFVSEFGVGNIWKFAPDGSRSLFASGLSNPEYIAFDDAGNLFEIDNGSGKIYRFTPVGSRSVFASGFPTGLGGLHSLVFGPIPEPSTAALLVIGCIVAWVAHRG